MALLDRVKERIETDLSDAELGSLISEAQAEIVSRFGPDRDTGDPLVLEFSGFRRYLDLIRPLDPDQTVAITEKSRPSASAVTLTTADWTLRNEGRTIERLERMLVHSRTLERLWDAIVEVTYVPKDDQPQRDEATIKLVQLSIAYEAVDARSVGDVSTTHKGFRAERDAILDSISPRKGLLIA